MAERRVVVLDACVLYPAPLRDLLMHLLLAGLYRARWSDAIHEEWISAVLERRPDVKRQQLDRTRALMDQVGLDALVSNYESIIPTIKHLPDPDDAHVVAAAIKGEANTILTFNTRDFPAKFLKPLKIDVLRPDAFVCELLENAPSNVFTAMHNHRASLKNPLKSANEYLDTLLQQSLTKTVQVVREFGEKI